MRSLVATLALCSLVLVAAWPARAAPPPPPAKFWTVSHCERTLGTHNYGAQTADGHHFWFGQRLCVGTGGSRTCEWTSDHRSRLYSEFTVFTRSRYHGGVVRSLTLTTRGGQGMVMVVHRYGDQWVGWPADFFLSPASVKLLATDATPARFRSIVAPIAARLTKQQNAADCTGR